MSWKRRRVVEYSLVARYGPQVIELHPYKTKSTYWRKCKSRDYRDNRDRFWSLRFTPISARYEREKRGGTSWFLMPNHSVHSVIDDRRHPSRGGIGAFGRSKTRRSVWKKVLPVSDRAITSCRYQVDELTNCPITGENLIIGPDPNDTINSSFSFFLSFLIRDKYVLLA